MTATDILVMTSPNKKNSAVFIIRKFRSAPVYSCPEAQPRCLVYLLDTYFAKFTPQAIELDLFYLRPKKAPAGDIWYDNVAIGRDKLASFLRDMCREAGITEKKTNHSLHATGASALFTAGLPEKLMRDVTGHRSNALHLYDRPSLQQQQEVSKVLVQGSSDKENAPKSENVPVRAHPMKPVSSNVFGSIFSSVNNCTITISPQNFSVNVYNAQTNPDVDVNALLHCIDLETFLS